MELREDFEEDVAQAAKEAGHNAYEEVAAASRRLDHRKADRAGRPCWRGVDI